MDPVKEGSMATFEEGSMAIQEGRMAVKMLVFRNITNAITSISN